MSIVAKSLAEWLRESARSGLLFGRFDEPLDDYGKRIVRAILVELERGSDEGSAWVQPPDAPQATGYAPTASALADPKTVVGEVAALLAPQGAGWQPIETAPKDGTPILGCKLTWTHPYVFCFLNSPGLLEGWHDFNVSAEGRRPHDLTHWMPLPSVPAALLAPQVQACSFCGTAHHAVALLICPAPESSVFICDGCVRMCLDIMREKALLAPPPRRAELKGDETNDEEKTLARDPPEGARS